MKTIDRDQFIDTLADNIEATHGEEVNGDASKTMIFGGVIACDTWRKLCEGFATNVHDALREEALDDADAEVRAAASPSPIY